MSKAEERALEVYPSTPNWDERITCMYRGGFIKGYEQAEKDLKLTWKDIANINDIVSEMLNDCNNDILYDTEKDFCQEVLKRFELIK